MKKGEAKPGDLVELADKDGGFYDSETELNISRDQQVALGDRIGNRTQMALLAGGLLLVSDSDKKAAVKDDSDLPADLPGRDAFIAAGMNFEAVKDFNFETGKVAGVGPATVKALREYAETYGTK